VVAIGGGTGLSALLHGLKDYARLNGSGSRRLDITAVVTVTDDGGSSGRLRRDFDALPPGDIRNCMVALSEDEALLARLFQYRFESGRGLKGHSFGNLFLTALTHVMGDFAEAVRASAEVLAIAGRIYPSTAENVSLEAVLSGGAVVTGETRISRSRVPIERIRLNPSRCRPLPGVLAALAEADLITFGPGSLYTSVIPNLLVEGIPEAIRRSRAVKAYFVNLMSQPGETVGLSASEHVRAIHEHAGRRLLDYAVVNTRRIPESLKQTYARQRALPVENDLEKFSKMGVEVITANLVQPGIKIRHNPEQVAEITLRLAAEGRRRRQRP